MRHNRRPIQPSRPRHQKIIDTRPIVIESARLAELRKRRGLVSEWTSIVNSLDADLRGFAQNLMAEIGDFFVRRSLAPATVFSW